MINCCFAETFTGVAGAAAAGIVVPTIRAHAKIRLVDIYNFLDMVFSITKKAHSVNTIAYRQVCFVHREWADSSDDDIGNHEDGSECFVAIILGEGDGARMQ